MQLFLGALSMPDVLTAWVPDLAPKEFAKPHKYYRINPPTINFIFNLAHAVLI